MSIRFIYFDLGNVLLDFSHEQGYAQIAAVTATTVDQVRTVFAEQELGHRYESGELSTPAFHRELCAATKSRPTQEQVMEAWGDIFVIKPQTVALAASLRSSGHRIGILSNTCEAHWDFARRRFRVLSQLFDEAVTSYDVKAMKPDVRIYEVAARRAATSPDELFFVDDRHENVEAAANMGWHTRLFDDARGLASDLDGLGVASNW